MHTGILLASGPLVRSHSSELLIEVDLKDLPSNEDSQQPARNIPRPYLRPRAMPQFQNAKVASRFPAPCANPVYSPAPVHPIASSAAAPCGAVEKLYVPVADDSAERSASGVGGPSYGTGGGIALGQIKPVSLPQIPLQTRTAYEQPDQTIAYQSIIHRHIDSRKRFPSLAARKGWEGNVSIRFLLHRDGQVEQIQITRSSRIALLDEAAIAAVKNGNPFPPFPSGIQESSIWFEVTLNFELRGRGVMNL
ncbi:MAG: energy transducer TonB [bacterium]